MKELSIEEKAKAYDEAIERGKQIQNTPYTAHWDIMKDVVEHLFPELKESNDERIRKELIEHCKNKAEPYIQTGNECPQIQSWITWLEKQGHTDSIIEKAKTEKQRVIISETDGDANIDWDTRSLEDTKRLLECGLQYINRELEKQGEQEEPQVYETEYGEVITYSESEGYKVIEPKFKVGDWITDGKSVLHITKFEDDYGYELKTIDGEVFHFISPDLVKANYHLWTIQDAKKGDVLVDEDINVIGIFEGIEGMCWHSKFYYSNVTKEFYGMECGGSHQKEFAKPATKEQRDTLMKAMADAGWEFDFDKKELKKIENESENYKQQVMFEMADLAKDYIRQKHTWNEEDENRIKDTIHFLRNAKKYYLKTTAIDSCIDWLKSLEDRRT